MAQHRDPRRDTMIDDMRRREFLPVLAAPLLLPSDARGAFSQARVEYDPILSGINRVENHDYLEATFRDAIEAAARAGTRTIPAFAGNRDGLDDRIGADNSVAFLNRIKVHAGQHGVTICLAMLNSKIDYPDYQFDRLSWGVDVVERAGSPNVKIHYDIYHAQVMEGDIANSLRQNIQHIGYISIGKELPELNYGFIQRTLANIGFTGVLES